MKKLGKWLGYTILGLVIAFFTTVLLMPTVFLGNLAIVRSSSMEPAMPAGALALMVPIDPQKVQVGDIIAFDPPWDPDVTVSHRVIDIRRDGQLLFDTKGDATEEPDPYYVPAEHVHGKVVFNIPYMGYVASSVVRYVRTWLGFVSLVCIPMVIIVGSVIRDVNQSRNVRLKRLAIRLERQRRYKRR